MRLSGSKEGKVQISCEVSEEIEKKLKEIREKKGRRVGWIIRRAIEKFLKGEIDV